MNHYQQLEVEPGATPDEILRSFKRLAKLYHPDKSSDPSHHEKFIKVREAYEVLKSPEKRLVYDTSIHVPTAQKKTYTRSGFQWSAFQTAYASRMDFNEYRRAQEEKIRKDAEAKRAQKQASYEREELRKRQQQTERMFSDNLYTERKKQAYRAQWSEPLKVHDEDVFSRGGRNDPIVVDEPKVTPDPSESNPEVEEIVVDSELEQDTEEKEKEEQKQREEEERKKEELQRQQEEQERARQKEQDDLRRELLRAEELKKEELKKESERKDRLRQQELRDDFRRVEELKAQLRKKERREENHETANKEPPKKKSRLDLTDLEGSLANDIGLDNLDELLTTIDPSQQPRKRQKTAEYSNGSSHADTLHTPLNKQTFQPSSGVRMADFNASRTIYNVTAPSSPKLVVDNTITDEEWGSYLDQIQHYQRLFMEYKTKIIRYQAERASRDDELHSLINSDPEVFRVHLRCLNQDSAILEKYSQDCKMFNKTMELYEQNCRWRSLMNRAA